MPLSEVSQAVYDYLEPSASNIPYLGVVYTALPPVSNESDLFENTFPGLALGATIYMFFGAQVERRIALGGPPPPYGGGGEKFREYDLGLMVVLKSDAPAAEPEIGQAAYHEFIDALTHRIQADRAAGTDAPEYGGNGSGIVFQWGEGGINGGDDIRFDHMIPRLIQGGIWLYQGVGHITTCEVLNT